VFFTQDWRTPPGVSLPTVLAIWFTYDAVGQQMWLIGQANGARPPFTMSLLRPVGTHFGAGFHASEVNRTAWGTATVTFPDCNHLQLSYTSTGFGAGTLSLERLTQPIGTGTCAP
jgi:hypothetical protein